LVFAADKKEVGQWKKIKMASENPRAIKYSKTR
jgi:hypothetical protein